MKNRIFAICIFILSSITVFAQYDLEVSVGIAPPFPTNLDAYAQYLEAEIISINNNSTESVEAFLEFKFEEESGKISFATDRMTVDPITFQPGITLLTPDQIQALFLGATDSDFQTTGLSDAERMAIYQSRQIPEGNYRMCIVAYDEFGTALSDPSEMACAGFPIYFAERPIITSHFNDMINYDETGSLIITWTHNLTNPESIFNTEYNLKILDLSLLDAENSDVTQLMLNPGVIPAYSEDQESKNTAILYHPEDIDLIKGNKYAIRVTAYDPMLEIAYQNGGHSEIVVFQYGELDLNEEEQGDEFEVLPSPILIAPESGFLSMRLDPLEIPLDWSHELEDDSLKSKLKYAVKVIDMDSLKITEVALQNFVDDSYEYIWDESLEVDTESDTSSSVLVSSNSHQLHRDRKYAIVVYVESEDDRIQWENEGYSEIIQFVIGEEEEEVDAEEGCGGDCLADLPKNREPSPIKKGDNLFMGNLMLTVDEVVQEDEGGYRGKGSIFVNFMKQIHIKVEFSNLEANVSKYVFAGEASAIFDESTVKADGLVSVAASSALNIDFDAAKALSTTLRNSGKLASAFSGKKVSLPLGFDRDVDGDKMIVGITQMDFTPQKATMTALFSLENPEWGDYVPTLGAKDICFTRQGFGSVVRLYLGKDYNIPLSNELLTLIASENNTNDEKGTYCIIDCDGFKEGQLTAEVGISRELLLPEDENGSIVDEGFVKLKFNGTFTRGSGFMLSAEMSPCQIPGLEGFSLTMEDGFYDSSDEVNPGGLKFPQGYSRAETDNTWKGVWFKEIKIKAPQGWGFADGEDRTSAGIQNFIKDKAGISIVAEADSLLGIDKGEIEGFAVSIDKVKLDILRGQFKEVKTEGRLGLPVLAEGDYLSYEGIIDREANEDDNAPGKAGAASDKSLSMRFVVKPDEEGYGLDWIKSHIDFDESSEFVLLNDSQKRGFKGTMSGSLTINSSMDNRNNARDAGLPDIKLPGLEFTGMEISRIKDKTDKSSKDAKKDSKFVFKKPNFSFMGVNLSDIASEDTDQEDEGEDEEDEDEDESDDSSMKLNGFSFNLTAMDFDIANANSSGESEIANGSEIKLAIAGQVGLVKGKKGSKSKGSKNEGLAVSAAGGFSIFSTFTADDKKLEFNRMQFDSLSIDAQVSAMRIYGSLSFYNDDDEFGDGAVGEIKLELPIFEVDIEGRFGSKPQDGSTQSYNYWYLFGDGRIVGKPPTFYNIISLYGINGGAYYHMTDSGKGESAKDRYKPNLETSLGLKIGLTISITEPEVLWANPNLFAEFNASGGLSKLGLSGRGYALKSEMVHRKSGEDVEGVEVIIDAQLNFTDDTPSLNADVQVLVNVQDAIKGSQKNAEQTDQMVDAKLVIDADGWSLFMGTPSEPGSLSAEIPGLGFGVSLEAYLMMGNKSLPEMKLPVWMIDIMGAETYGKFSSNDSASASDVKSERNEGGVVMGANLHYKLPEITASILYASFEAGLGFDISFTKSQVTCSNNDNKPKGIDGWYAEGQVYAGLKGDVGLDIDNFLYNGKLSLVSLKAGLALKGGFPSPFYGKGVASMEFSVLGGVMSGNQSFYIEVGEQCEENIANPFAGIDFIASLSPPDRADKVSPFVSPKLSLNQRLGEYTFHIPRNGGRVEKTFNVYLDKFIVKDKNGNVVSSTRDRNTNLEYVLRMGQRLEAEYKGYTVYACIKGKEKINGKWEIIEDPKTGKDWVEEETYTFNTGKLPDNIVRENIKITYPFIGENNYMHDNNQYKTGLFKFIHKVDYLFKQAALSTDEWRDVVKAKFYVAGNLVSTQDFIDKRGRTIEFKMPPQIKKETVYEIRIVRTYELNPNYRNTTTDVGDKVINYDTNSSYTVKRNGKLYSNYDSSPPVDKELFSYYFASSKYENMYKKLLDTENRGVVSHVTKPDVKFFRCGKGEGFSKSEINQDIWQSSTKNIGKVSIKTRTLVNEYYNTLSKKVVPALRDIREHVLRQLDDDDCIKRLGDDYKKGVRVVDAIYNLEYSGSYKVLERFAKESSKYQSEDILRDYIQSTGGQTYSSVINWETEVLLYNPVGAYEEITPYERYYGKRIKRYTSALFADPLYNYHALDHSFRGDRELFEAVADYYAWAFCLNFEKDPWKNWKEIGDNFLELTRPNSSRHEDTEYKFKVTYTNPQNSDHRPSGKDNYSKYYYVTFK